MEYKKIVSLIEENMKTIFAYSLSRVSNKENAEDLCGDIILSILTSAPRIRDDDAFFGYIWAIAANTYKKYLRKKNRAIFTQLDEETPSDDDFTVELYKTEELMLLRRELSLLSREYRKCTVTHYIDGFSCAETAKKLGISLEMVKYYLFKTRKLLKEGIGMEREFGVKSYKPADFEFVTIFSGQYNHEYKNLFNRKLPGNILMSVYYTPMTIRELSIELGVASAYMEDEVALLEKYKLLIALPGGRYQTNLVIFTSEYTSEFYKSAHDLCTSGIGEILENVKISLPEIRAVGFRGNKLDENRLLWPLLWFIMHKGNTVFEQNASKNQPDRIYEGATGINYGINYDESGFDTPKDKSNLDKCSCGAFAGYFGIDNRYAAAFADFGVLPKRCMYSYHSDIVKAALNSDNDSYMILTVSELDKITSLLQPQIEEMSKLYDKLRSCAAKLMRVHAPESIGELVEKIITKTLFFRTAGFIGKCGVDSGVLAVPDGEKPVAVFLYETTEHDRASVSEDVQV